MKRSTLVTLALLPFAVSSLAHQAPTAGFGKQAAKAPTETAQFAFLVGEWHCTTKSMRPDGSLFDGPDATWTGYYILDGWAIQDEWQSHTDGSLPGTNIRSFNPETKKWDNRWLAAGSLQWSYFEAEKVGDTMVMLGGESVDGQGRPYTDRNIFYELRDKAWKWRKDRSYDGGKNWIQGVAHIHCSAQKTDPHSGTR